MVLGGGAVSYERDTPVDVYLFLTRVAYRFYIVYRQSLLGPVDPSFRALSGRLKFTVRRHKFNKDSCSRRAFRGPGPGPCKAFVKHIVLVLVFKCKA